MRGWANLCAALAMQGERRPSMAPVHQPGQHDGDMHGGQYSVHRPVLAERDEQHGADRDLRQLAGGRVQHLARSLTHPNLRAGMPSSRSVMLEASRRMPSTIYRTTPT